MTETRFLHMVYFYPAADGRRADAEKLADGCRTYLKNVPGVLRLAVGTAAGTPRDVVDNSYAVALLVEFADAAGHDVYADHPEHLRFIADHQHLWSRVQVYDSMMDGVPLP